MSLNPFIYHVFPCMKISYPFVTKTFFLFLRFSDSFLPRRPFPFFSIANNALIPCKLIPWSEKFAIFRHGSRSCSLYTLVRLVPSRETFNNPSFSQCRRVCSWTWSLEAISLMERIIHEPKLSWWIRAHHADKPILCSETYPPRKKRNIRL